MNRKIADKKIFVCLAGHAVVRYFGLPVLQVVLYPELMAKDEGKARNASRLLMPGSEVPWTKQ